MSLFAAVKVGDSLQQALDSFFGFLPNLLGFLVILVIGYIVARAVKGILTKVLTKVGLDKALHSGQSGQYVEKVSPGASPSKLVGSIAFWFLFLGAVSLAVSALSGGGDAAPGAHPEQRRLDVEAGDAAVASGLP